MKQLFFLLLMIFFYMGLSAQGIINIDLTDWKGKKESVPFTIAQVSDARSAPINIGILEKNKSKKTIINFASNSALMITQFVNKQFDQEADMNVLMQIEVLEIETVRIKNKEVAAFIFACKFYKQGDENGEPLYSFNARNSITNKKGLKLAMTNYIGRSLTSAILNFRKSYLKHPEWQKVNKTMPAVALKKTILYNKMESGDTIALNGQYKLQQSDFSAVVDQEEQEDAFSNLIITYTLDYEENDNIISISVFPKAFFIRSRSWSKQADSTNWLSHQQLLFDLASYHGFLFKKALEQFNFSPGFYKAEANKIYNEMTANYFDEMDRLQGETNYGSLPEKVTAWRNKVNKYLEKL